MTRQQRLSIIAVAAALGWSNAILPAVPFGRRGRTVVNAAFATGFAAAFAGPVTWVTPRGVALGSAAAAVPVGAFVVAASTPAGRKALRGRDTGADGFTEWVTVHIPVGTVYAEELIFRGTLGPRLERSFGPAAGRALSAATFGLWHIRPAQLAGDSIAGTVVTTAAAGLIFDWLYRRGGSLVAPALLHLATNVGGAVAVRAVAAERTA